MKKLSVFRNRLAAPLMLFTIMLAGLAVFVAPFVSSSYAQTLPTSCNDAANEVLWCGAATPQQTANDYFNGDGHNSAASIQNIYSYFGITSSEMQALPQTAVAGTVTKSGDVIVNGQTVATQAVTGGRQYIPGSTQASVGGTTFFVRPPSVSFIPASLDAFVVMHNNQFVFAILSSCGNAVMAKPIPPPPPPPPPPPQPTPGIPNYLIKKQVSKSGINQWSSEIPVSPNSKVDYRVVVASNGSANVTNLIVKDTLPNDDTYDSGTLTNNGQPMPSSDASNFFTSGFTIGTLAPNTTDTFEFEATVGANQDNANCTNETLPNVATMQASELPNESATATVSIVCVPPAPPPPPTPAIPVAPTAAPPPSPAPKQLINTGPGSIIGAFTGFGVAGGAGYTLFQKRRLWIKSSKN